MGAPHPIAGANPAKINLPIAKPQFQGSGKPRRHGGHGGFSLVSGKIRDIRVHPRPILAHSRHLVDAATFFRFGRAAPVGGVEDQAIARFERRGAGRCFGLDEDVIAPDVADDADFDAAMGGGTAVHHRLMVRPGHKMRTKPARIHLLKLQLLGRGDGQIAPRPRFVYRLPVGAGGQGDVIGVFVASFNLQRRHAQLHDVGHLLQGVEVAGREQVAGVIEWAQAVIDNHLVGQATRLGALAAIGAAAAPRLGGEALAGVGDAQRAMHKHFQLAGGRGADGADVVQGEFAGQHHAADPKLLRQVDAFGAGQAHLRAAVDGQVGGDLPRQLGHGHVLHDDAVGAGGGDVGQSAHGFIQFVVEDEGVEGDVAFDAALVERAHHVGQFAEGEADFGAGGEVVEAKVDGVGAGFDGGVQLGPVAGRTHDFGFVIDHRGDFTSEDVQRRHSTPNRAVGSAIGAA